MGSTVEVAASEVVLAANVLLSLVVASRNDERSSDTLLEALLTHISDLFTRYRQFRDICKAQNCDLYPHHDAFLRAVADLQHLILKYQKSLRKCYGEASSSVTLRKAFQMFPPTSQGENASHQILEQLSFEFARMDQWRESRSSSYHSQEEDAQYSSPAAPKMRRHGTSSSVDRLQSVYPSHSDHNRLFDAFVDTTKYSPDVMKIHRSPVYDGSDVSTPRPSTMGQTSPEELTPTWNSSPFSTASHASTTATSIGPEPLELPQPWLAIPSPKERITGPVIMKERIPQSFNNNLTTNQSLSQGMNPYRLLHAGSSSMPTPRQLPNLGSLALNTSVPPFSSYDSPSDRMATSPTSPISNPRILETMARTSGGAVAKQALTLIETADLRYTLFIQGQRRPSHPTQKELARHVKTIAIWRDPDTRLLLAIRSYEDNHCTVNQKPSSTSPPVPHIDIASLTDFTVFFLNNPPFRLEGPRASLKLDDLVSGEYKIIYTFRCEDDWRSFQEVVLNRAIDGFYTAEKIKCTPGGGRTSAKLSYNQVIRVLRNGRGERFVHFLAHNEMNAFFEIPVSAFARTTVRDRSVYMEFSTDSNTLALSSSISGTMDMEPEPAPALPAFPGTASALSFRGRRGSSVSMQSQKQYSEPWQRQMWRDISITFKSSSDAALFTRATA
ncbi:hypothetical protein AA313_de0206119 [Arthrobotrys entomopaga]|nr:hypothetical protein AA313_de0206119 [Arthrobotrys entomopaga]